MHASQVQRRDAEATRAAILDAAQKLFLEKGFGQVSTSELAEAAGVTKSLIHHHFGSKHELWSEVHERMFAAYCDVQEQMLLQAKDPTAELLRDSLAAYFEFSSKHRDMSRSLAWTALEREHLVNDRERALNALGVAKIREGQEKGRLRADVDPRMVLCTFFALVEHWSLFRERMTKAMGLPAGDEGDARYLDTILKVFMEGMIPR